MLCRDFQDAHNENLPLFENNRTRRSALVFKQNNLKHQELNHSLGSNVINAIKSTFLNCEETRFELQYTLFRADFGMMIQHAPSVVSIAPGTFNVIRVCRKRSIGSEVGSCPYITFIVKDVEQRRF